VPSTRITRSSSKYYLIGELCESIQGVKLPTTRQILQYILYFKKISLPNCPIYALIKQAVKEVLYFGIWLVSKLTYSTTECKKKVGKNLANVVDAVKKTIKTDNQRGPRTATMMGRDKQ